MGGGRDHPLLLLLGLLPRAVRGEDGSDARKDAGNLGEASEHGERGGAVGDASLHGALEEKTWAMALPEIWAAESSILRNRSVREGWVIPGTT